MQAVNLWVRKIKLITLLLECSAIQDTISICDICATYINPGTARENIQAV